MLLSNRFWQAIFAFFILALSYFSNGWADKTGPNLGIPAYSYPGTRNDFWSQGNVAPAGSVFIMNPSSGAGLKPDPNYVAAVSKARRQKIKVYGYVDTAYAKRSLPEVLKDIQKYQAWYAVDGIFFDQAALSGSTFNYYKTLSDPLLRQKREVAFNPGQPEIDARFLTIATHVVTFEGTFSTYQKQRFPHWVQNAPAGKFWHLIYKVPDAAAMKQTLLLAGKRHAGVVYITNLDLPNPWGGTPSFWLAELQAVKPQ